MSKLKKFFIILAVIFIIIGLVLTGVSLTVAHFDVSNLSTVSYETKNYEFKESFNTINVDDIDCDIRIVASGNDVCKVTVGDTAGLSHQVEVKDKALQITLSDTRKWYEHIGIFSWEETEIVIQLPEEEYRSILLKTVSGDIEVADEIYFEDVILISTSGDVKLSGISGFSVTAASTSGDVQLTDINVKGLVASSTSGDIDMDTVNVENKAEIEAVSGDVVFDVFDAGVIEMKTSSGDVKGEIVTAKNFVTDTSSGDVRVPVSDPSAGDCVIKTVSGDIIIELE